MPMSKPKTFEEAMARLQTLLEALQDEATPLDEAVKLYAEAAGLLAFCHGALADAQLKIGQIDADLAKQMPSGEPIP